MTYQLVNAADYGVPQKRERVIIVGLRSDLNIKWSFPKPTHSEDSLLWDKYVTGDYWKHHNIANPEYPISSNPLPMRMFQAETYIGGGESVLSTADANR